MSGPAISQPATVDDRASVVPGALLVDLAARSGGAETRVLHLATALPPVGVPAVVVALAGSPLARRANEAGLPVATVRAHKWDPRNVLDLRRLVAAHPGWTVDAHNTQSQAAVLAAQLSRSRAPRPGGNGFVATVHSEYRRSEGRGARLREALLRQLEQCGWTTIAVTSSVATYLSGLGVRPSSVHTVWSAVLSDQSETSDETDGANGAARELTRAELQLAPATPVLLAVGRLVPAKNYPFMLRIAAALQGAAPHETAPHGTTQHETALHETTLHETTQHETAQHETVPFPEIPSNPRRQPPVLLIAGDGPLREQLEAQARDLGLAEQVRFLGHRDDVPALLAAADAVLLTSSTEGLPYTLLEAAAAGVPIITTAVGAIGEVFGEGAAVLLPDDGSDTVETARAAAEIIGQALADPAMLQRTRARAAQVVRSRLTLDRLIVATLAAYAARRPSGGR